MKCNRLIIQNLKKNSEWCDKSDALLYACFQLLVDFLEKERPEKIVDYKTNQEQRKEWRELQTLYRYWKIDRPKSSRDADKSLMKSGIKMVFAPAERPGASSGRIDFTFKDKREYNKSCRLDDKRDHLDEVMLQRLINIRHYLWC